MEVEDESVVVEQTTSAPLKTVVSFFYILYLLDLINNDLSHCILHMYLMHYKQE